MKIKAVIFDLDGTLVDSIQDIAICMNQVLKELGYDEHPEGDYQNFVGDGALMLVENALPSNCSQSIVNDGLKLFIEKYETGIHNNSKVYEGIYKMLDDIKHKNLKLAVLSNKPHEFTVEFIQYFFKDYAFVEIHGQKKEVPKKPDPMGAINISNALNIKPEDIIFIGDTPTDIKTAKNANMNSIGVSWGYRSVEELQSANADFIAQDTKHLAQLLLENS